MPSERRTCPLCGGGEFEPLFTGKDRMYGKPGEFPVVRCHSCALQFLALDFTFEELGRYYPTTYYSFEAASEHIPAGLKGMELRLRRAVEQQVLGAYLGYPLARSANPLIRWLAAGKRQRYAQTPHYLPDGRLLDVGCGGGNYLAAMRKLGWQVEGVEPGQSGVEAGRRQGLTIHHGTLETVQLPAASFDFVRFEHVLEHTPDPLATLREAARVLKAGGRIRVQVPNADSLPARQFGSYWYHLDTPRHLFWFTPTTLQRMAGQAGLHIESLSVEVDYSDLSDSLIYWLKEHHPALGVRMERRKGLWKWSNKLAWPLRWWMRRCGSGTLLTVTLTHRSRHDQHHHRRA